MTRDLVFLSRAGYIGTDEASIRTPELLPMRMKTISVFGLGCLGAPSALEFARIGTKEIRILDHDFVDPAAAARWPLGISVSGALKVNVISDFIRKNYPTTEIKEYFHRVGHVRKGEFPETSDFDIIEEMTTGSDLIYDATAEIGVHHYLSDVAMERGIPYISVSGTVGGWGGTIVRIVPGQTQGCWNCLQHAINARQIPEAPYDENGEVQGRGCADKTFTGAGFDMLQIACAGIRMVVSCLCSGHADGYPNSEWDVITIALRDATGNQILPTYTGTQIRIHSECQKCRSK